MTTSDQPNTSMAVFNGSLRPEARYRIRYLPRVNWSYPWRIEVRRWWGWTDLDGTAEQESSELLVKKLAKKDVTYFDADGNRIPR